MKYGILLLSAQSLLIHVVALSSHPVTQIRHGHGQCTTSSALMHDDDGCTFTKKLSPLATSRHTSLPFSTLQRVNLSAISSRTSTALSSSASTNSNNNNVGALFPSDDSDYEETNNGKSSINNNDDTATAVTKASNANNSIVSNYDNSDVFQSSTIFHPTQSRVKIGDYVFVDPIDVVADWISERLVEQSLQSKSSSSSSGNHNNMDGSITSDTNSVMESYSPGSALDIIAQASSTYTPLSYQIRTVVRTILPSLLAAIIATIVYPTMVHSLIDLPTSIHGAVAVADGGTTAATANTLLYDDQVLTVLSNDLSQYVQNILTTCALLFGMLVGQTYYFMYQQQEFVFYALFEEVTEAKSLLEQISLMTYGREGLYPSLLSRMNDYVQNDLKLLSIKDPIAVTSGLPKDDPLESILYATSVGLPGVMYETVKSLRQARANRCGALQRKLPALHIYCLRLLGIIVLAVFPVCGSGSQAIAPNVLVLQSYMFGILAFALTLVLNVVEELRNSRKLGAYNVDGVLSVMVSGLEQELEERLEGKFCGVGVSPGLPARVGNDSGGVEWDAGDHGVWEEEYERFAVLKSEIDNNNNNNAKISAENVGESTTESDNLAVSSSRGRRVKNWLRRNVLGRNR